RAPRHNPKGKGYQPNLDKFVEAFRKRKSGSTQSSRPCINKTPVLDCEGYDNPGAEGGESDVCIDLEAAQTWHYPLNVPVRDYQFAIAKVALFSNTLVALPTGLGKTLIAAVVMYNYFRWFPEGKIVFTAPSRPLVMQQIEACHNIVGIPQDRAIDMTGQMSPLKRLSFWKTRRVFFVTPQVLEKDIQSGICLVKQIVCLVIDEAHRATGNYSYCVAVRELMAVPVRFRILALTATPGSKQQVIQNVIDNLYISTLEYRNETDHDVSPYVHNRTIEVIEVEMGKDATNINNLLLEAMQPINAQLLSYRVLYYRDAATLSPCELFNLRDKFRQAPPSGLDQSKNKVIEGGFAMLITLCHIRKLLTSHGVRPAYEMLADKLQSGPFARSASKNETIKKAKLLMEQCISHGAPSPKLVKLREILTDHFKTKDPKNSRVIIFSNFRGSVRDIMDSLSTIRDLVKATEFIGQSSGKALKGQTQKVQQAVLQKFRTGGYNVIVATSIGEEGLDIMEVDLVICFDANVSPLRMIQRMGRTGRKSDGRVVVLACEGSEVKAYRKKQASGKAVRKHMHNGGIKSFSFHSSPRMVPHICKPKASFIKISIEKFIPRGKKSRDDSLQRTPVSKELLVEEKNILARYFHPAEEDIQEPSLIAFPIFQTFPSSVHELRHSFRTTSMLIDAMQHLRGLALCEANKDCLVEVDVSCQPPEAATVAVKNKEKATCYITEAIFEEKLSAIEELEEPLKETPENGLKIPSHPIKKFSSHCFLFGNDFVNVNSVGSVLIASVPRLPYKGDAFSKVIPSDDNQEMFMKTVSDAFSFEERTTQGISEVEAVPEQKLVNIKGLLSSQLQKYGEQKNDGEESFVLETSVSKQKIMYQEVAEATVNTVLETPVSKQKLMNHEVAEDTVNAVLENPVSKQKFMKQEVAENAVNAEDVLQLPLVFKSRDTLKDMDLSPRLSHFVEEGIVPESPILNQRRSIAEHIVSSNFTPTCVKHGSLVKSQSTSIHVKEDLILASSCLVKNESCEPLDAAHSIKKSSVVSMDEIMIADKFGLGKLKNCHESRIKRNILYSPINEDIHTPIVDSIGNSSSENWQQNSAEASKSSISAPQYKRLRKYRDIAEELPCQSTKEKDNCSLPNKCGPSIRNGLNLAGPNKGKRKKMKKYAISFIEEEAEVSQNAQVSEDEEDDDCEEGVDGSFIDDRTSPTEASTEEEDMVAFYRRSLLTQSPANCLQNSLATPYESFSSRTGTESCSSEKVCNHLPTHQTGLHSADESRGNQHVTHQVELERTIVCENPIKGYSAKLESRKRKLSFQNNGSSAAKSPLEQFIELEHSREVLQQQRQQPGNSDVGADLLCDDDFYQSIDLDAVEEQATKLLKHKSSVTVPCHSEKINEQLNMDVLCSPSFDLGI
ncbi:uncharacterized protein LOC109830850, partial [Asparagus officinalis]|uniref:uncharacterized protein LOC109830850 n=1 Tax=Asparagus officinalis TaxID=4686 RepID=UPI00098E7CDF